jgi:hypothetical protein
MIPDDDWTEHASQRIVDAARSLGVEVAINLGLVLVYGRWWADHIGRPGYWQDLVEQPEPSTQVDALGELAVDLSRRVQASLGLPTPSGDDGGAMQRAVLEVDELPTELLPAAFEALIGLRTRRLGRGGSGEQTPAEVAETMVAAAGERLGQTFDPACGFGECLLTAHRRGADSLIGFDVNAWAAAVTRMRLDLAGAHESMVVVDNALQTGVWPPADTILLQPPWNMRLADDDVRALAMDHPDLLTGRHPADLVWVQLATRSLRPDGRAIAFLPASTGFRTLPEAAVRAELAHSAAIEGWIGLPDNSAPKTSLKTALWVLRDFSSTNRERRTLIADLSGGVVDDAFGRYQGGLIDPAPFVAEALGSLREGDAELDLPRYFARIVDAGAFADASTPTRLLDSPPSPQLAAPAPPRRLLTELRVENFKSFGERQRIELAPITLIYGQNSAGKSSLLQSLLLLKQSLQAPTLITQGAYTDGGSFLGLLHRHELRRELHIGLSYGTLDRWQLPDGVPNPAALRHVDLAFRADGAGLPVRDVAHIGFDEATLRYVGASSSRTGAAFIVPIDEAEETFVRLATYGFLWREADMRRALEDSPNRLKGRRNNGRRAARQLRSLGIDTVLFEAERLLPGRPHKLNLRGLPEGREEGIVTSYVNRTGQIGFAVAHELENLLSDLVYLGPLRSAPQRFYDRAAAAAGAGTSGEQVALYLFDNSSDRAIVNRWLRRLGVPYTVDIVDVKAGETSVLGDIVAMVLNDTRSHVDVSPADVGFGVSQVLPIVVELIAASERVVCIEQPEIHLHPRLQTELGDLLIETTDPAGNANQVLVETHSEHLLLRLQRRIREQSLAADDLAVLYVDQDDEGNAFVTRLRLDQQGHFIDPWPEGFFEESLDELLGGIG